MVGLPRLLPVLASALVFSLCACDDDSGADSGDGDVSADTGQLGPDASRDLAPIDAPREVAADGETDDGAAEAGDSGPEVAEADGAASDTMAEDTADTSTPDLPVEDAPDGAPEVEFDVSQGQVASLTIDWLSEGGFTGFGHRDYHYEVGTLSLFYPYSDPTECGEVLSEEQVGELHAAAAAVDWESVESAYWPPDAPECSGFADVFFFALNVDITFSNGDPLEVDTVWCTTPEEVAMPADLRALLEVLEVLGDELLCECASICD